jgi:Ankyrin repeats (3 copies)
MRNMLRILVAAALLLPAFGADTPPDISDAARKGRNPDIEALLAKGVDIETKDKDGRTPLMLAAQYGRKATVELLLARGAKPDARDPRGWNAYMFALLAPAGGVAGVVHSSHDAVLKLLPQPRRFRLQLNSGWTPGNSIFSSCFMRPPEMTEHVRELRVDAMVADALQRFAASTGRGLIAIVRVDARGTAELSNLPPAADADGTLDLLEEPGAACVQGVDRLTLSIRARLFLGGGNAPVMDRTFGEGVKTGMRTEAAMNANQHGPLYQAWAKSQAGPIYWAAVEALLAREW